MHDVKVCSLKEIKSMQVIKLRRGMNVKKKSNRPKENLEGVRSHIDLYGEELVRIEQEYAK